MVKKVIGASQQKAETPSFLDFAKLLKQYRLPGVDMDALVEHQKKNIEALTKANKIAYDGWQNLLHKQTEILQATINQTIAAARTEIGAEARAKLAEDGLRKALDHMRDLAQIAANSQKGTFEVIRKRVEESLKDLRGKK